MINEAREMKCSNCMYFNGGEGDMYQFCDEREEDVFEDGFCMRWRIKRGDAVQ